MPATQRCPAGIRRRPESADRQHRQPGPNRRVHPRCDGYQHGRRRNAHVQACWPAGLRGHRSVNRPVLVAVRTWLQADSTDVITVKVTDNGFPSMSATSGLRCHGEPDRVAGISQCFHSPNHVDGFGRRHGGAGLHCVLLQPIWWTGNRRYDELAGCAPVHLTDLTHPRCRPGSTARASTIKALKERVWWYERRPWSQALVGTPSAAGAVLTLRPPFSIALAAINCYCPKPNCTPSVSQITKRNLKYTTSSAASGLLWPLSPWSRQHCLSGAAWSRRPPGLGGKVKYTSGAVSRGRTCVQSLAEQVAGWDTITYHFIIAHEWPLPMPEPAIPAGSPPGHAP